MANRKNRVRLARIAAGAVFAAGASLTAAGAAQAEGLGGAFGINPSGLMAHAVGGPSQGPQGTTGDVGTSGLDTSGGVSVGGLLTSGGPTPTTGGNNGSAGGQRGTEGPTQGTQGQGTQGQGTRGQGTQGSTHGTQGPTQGTTTGGPSSSPVDSGGGGTCTLSQDTVNCGANNTSTDNNSAPQQVVTQGKPKQQLAETGSNSAEIAFLLIGAATMIAGGVGFRIMPRMVTRKMVA